MEPTNPLDITRSHHRRVLFVALAMTGIIAVGIGVRNLGHVSEGRIVTDGRTAPPPSPAHEAIHGRYISFERPSNYTETKDPANHQSGVGDNYFYTKPTYAGYEHLAVAAHPVDGSLDDVADIKSRRLDKHYQFEAITRDGQVAYSFTRSDQAYERDIFMLRDGVLTYMVATTGTIGDTELEQLFTSLTASLHWLH